MMNRIASAAGVAACIIVFVWAQAVLATPPGSKYSPGETLNPNCAAGDSNCTVTAPLTVISDGDITSAKILDGTIVNTDISNSASVAYSKLNLAGSILNADVSNSAAIAFSKLNIVKSDITGLGIPGSDTNTTYSAGTGLSLAGTTFGINSSVVTSNYPASVVLNGSISPANISASTSSAGIPNTMTNTASNAGAGVLKLTLSNIANPDSTNHYIDFYSNAGSIGSIRGDGAGGAQMALLIGNESAFNTGPGLQFVSAGADYAEYMERADHAEVLRAGDVVGVKEGKISRSTAHADRAMVVSATPVVLGNQPANNVGDFTVVAFVGQVLARAAGPVTSGQYIVASGKNDGIGLAKDKDDLTADDLVVGQAWETDATRGETLVKVGIVPGPVIQSSVTTDGLQNQIDELRKELKALRSLLHAK